MLQAYDEGRLDKLYVVSNKFINTMSQVPTITQLLPLPASEDADLKRKSGLPTLLRRYVEFRFIRAWLKTWPASRPPVWWR